MIKVILLRAPCQNVNVLLLICNQFPTRKLDTWRHRSRDHWTRDGSFSIGGPLDSSLYL